MFDFKAKKSLGQNFLKSEKALNKIIEVSEIKEGDKVLEIGPGKGALTEKILQSGAEIVTVEKDRRSVEFLKYKFKDLNILEEDILDFNLSDSAFGDFTPPAKRGGVKSADDKTSNKYKVIANIPYYITGEIIRKFLTSENQPESMTLLVQKEVAERIVAKDEKESILSISVKIFGNPRYVETVKRGSFTPSPNVDSAILHISNISKEKLEDVSEEEFFKIVKSGFAHKRKQLGSNLKEVIENAEVFENCNVNKTDRAEDLSLDQWICLSKSNFKK